MKRPIRSYPRYDIKEPFEVTTDFSAKAVGAILSQVQNGRERFLGSAARKTTKFEANYGSVKGELAAVMMALRKWEHLLLEILEDFEGSTGDLVQVVAGTVWI